MPEIVKIIETRDGSHSLLNLSMNETYHSLHGALQESVHVFIRNGLQYWLHHHKGKPVSILEVGFGTGLNVLLTVQEALHTKVQVAYTTLEPFPLPMEMIHQLNYPALLDDPQLQYLFTEIHQCPWQQEVALLENFRFTKLNQPLQDLKNEGTLFDIIYFDAFAPNKQPDLWTYAMLAKVTSFLRKGGVWVTYSAMGQMKRDLNAIGLSVETLAGPPGKAEMVRAVNS